MSLARTKGLLATTVAIHSGAGRRHLTALHTVVIRRYDGGHARGGWKILSATLE